jgi:hypothetical protein
MELTLLSSIKAIVSHIITQDLKIFRQKWYTLFSLFSFNFDSYRKNGLPLLHKVVLHYKIIPACNIWHIFVFSGAIKQLEAIKPFDSLLACFKSLLHPTDFQIFWLKDRKMKAWLFKKRLSEKFDDPCFHCNCKRLLPYLWQHSSILADIVHSVFHVVIVPALSFTIFRLEETNRHH